ncbi:MAG: M43 family zinc metalloprotease [Bacteroidota bacterium]
MKTYLFILLAIVLTIPTRSQIRRCGTDEYMSWWIENRLSPQVKTRWEQDRAKAFNLKNHPQSRRPTQHQMLMNESEMLNMVDETPQEIVIPIVVHVIAPLPGHPANISDEQIYSQIDVLNEEFSREITEADFGRTYPPFWRDRYPKDTKIRFCLADRDPDNKPTRGITRTFSPITEFAWLDSTQAIKFTAMGGKDIWDRDRYLNIWVSIIDSVAGYSPVPVNFIPRSVDGIVVDYRYFGTIGPVSPLLGDGITAIHEIGHWLGLFHPWGEMSDNPDCELSDLVEDTPPTAEPAPFECPTTPFNQAPFSTSLITSDYLFGCGERVMLRNFMDYAPDACSRFFTQGQVNRMRRFLSPGGFRELLPLSEQGCGYGGE